MKSKTEFICSNCGLMSPKWLGKCTSCGQWDSFTEVNRVSENKKSDFGKRRESKLYKLSEIDYKQDFRIKTNITELDRALGGGIVPGSLVLVGGDPGIGKSTLMLQMAAKLTDYSPIYVTGEESLRQIKHRSLRLSHIPGEINIYAETNIEAIDDVIKSSDAEVIIIDSIQSVYTDKVDSTPGSLAQVRECSSLLMQTAKSTGKAIFIIGHVTKDGYIAGPKMLEHLVDTVLQFEGDKTYSYRILRALKNRYGSTNEIGIFDMAESGLNEVKNPSELFLTNRLKDEPGVAIVSAIEGSRPILLEVQALVSPTGYSMPQRTVNGFELRRLQMILAVLEKRLGIKFYSYDVFVNVAGGIYLNDPSVDIGIAAALIGSQRDIAIGADTLLIGEMGLTGEVRPIANLEQRLSEAEKLGFQTAFVPKGNNLSNRKFKMNIKAVDRISIALSEIFK